MTTTWNDDVECGICGDIFDKGTPMHIQDVGPPVCDGCRRETPGAVQSIIKEYEKRFDAIVKKIKIR